MRRSRFSEEQIIGVPEEHEAGMKPSDLCRKHGISETPLHKWKAKFGGMTVPETASLRTLEQENRRLSLLWQKCDFWDSLCAECVIHGEPALTEAGDGRGLAGGS